MVALLILLSLTPPARAAEPLTCDQIASLADSGITVTQLRPILHEHGARPGVTACLRDRQQPAAVVRLAKVAEDATRAQVALHHRRPHRVSTGLAVGGVIAVGLGSLTGIAGNQTGNINQINAGVIVGGLGVITVATSAIAYLVEFAIIEDKRQRWGIDARGFTLRLGRFRTPARRRPTPPRERQFDPGAEAPER